MLVKLGVYGVIADKTGSYQSFEKRLRDLGTILLLRND